MTVATIAQMKAANKAAGHHFFDKDAMEFFNSRIEDGVYEHKGGTYFITSEQYDESSDRRYTVRRFTLADGHVATVGEFQGHDTYAAARQVVGAIVDGGRNG